MWRCAFFDDGGRSHFLPFTFSRPSSELRFGILSIREKWEEKAGVEASWLSAPYLREKFPFPEGEAPEWLINGRLIPDSPLLEEMEGLKAGEALVSEGTLLALRTGGTKAGDILPAYDRDGVRGLQELLVRKERNPRSGPELLDRKWELFTRNGEALKNDHELLKNKRSSVTPSPTNTVIGDEIFIEEGAQVEHASLNSSNGPIHIAAEAEVMEGAMIRGPFYLGPHGVVKMGAKIYGPTTIGPYGKVGGELNNVVLFGYSNKAHDGFLGNSVVGEWCNLGADTNNSNLKNNYGSVKVWDHERHRFEDSGLTFCGIFMGDHSKCGIDTMFNTGTTIGFSANVFDAGFPPKLVPSFSWGGASGIEEFRLEKAKEVAERMRARRELPFDAAEERIFDTVHSATVNERNIAG